MKSAHSRTPVKDAYSTLEQYWQERSGDLTLPINPFEIAALMGVTVVKTIMGSKDSGYLKPGPLGELVIYLNEDHSLNRQRFTCAHELGHLVDHDNRGIPVGMAHRDERSAHGTHTEEIYANRFAAALLMPKWEVERLHQMGLGVAQLARRFRVSESAMEWRLTNLGLN